MEAVVTYHVKMILEGVAEELVFPVTENESDRIRKALDANRSGFVVFDTTDRRTIAVSIDRLQTGQFSVRSRGVCSGHR